MHEPRALERKKESPPWAHRALTKETQIPWGSCALAWAVKEVPDSEAGPPDAELPRQTELDPLPQGEARKARACEDSQIALRPPCQWIALQLNPASRVDGR